MKNGRHQKIVELVTQRQIETQEELADLLNAEGFRVTQATVSRDIKALQLSKAPGRGGRQYYQILKKDSSEGKNIPVCCGRGCCPWTSPEISW